MGKNLSNGTLFGNRETPAPLCFTVATTLILLFHWSHLCQANLIAAARLIFRIMMMMKLLVIFIYFTRV